MEAFTAFLGAPSTSIIPILFTKRPLLAYASADTIALVDAHTLCAARTLAFWEALPATFDGKEAIEQLAVDVENKLIIATSGGNLAAWLLSSIAEDTWRVHSTLVLHSPVTRVTSLSGRLVVGTGSDIALYQLGVDHDLPSWTVQWRAKVSRPLQVAFSPSGSLLALRTADLNIRILLASTGRQIQTLRHPRPLTHITWRTTPSNRDENTLLTTTADHALRIFHPVLDAPHHLQLHATIDPYAFLPSSTGLNSGSPVFWINRVVMRSVFGNVLRDVGDAESQADESQRRRLTELYEEGWDLFCRILDDGSIVIRAVANLDRRPPTLLKQFTLVHSLFDPPLRQLPDQFQVLSSSNQIALITAPPISVHMLSPLPFFDAKRDGLTTITVGEEIGETSQRPIRYLSRSPDGHAVAVVRDGVVEVYKVMKHGSGLQFLHRYTIENDAIVLVFHFGSSVAIYTPSQNTLTAHIREVPNPITLTIPQTLTNLFLIPPNYDVLTYLVGITASFEIIQIHVQHPPGEPKVYIDSISRLPDNVKPVTILPVDPMEWAVREKDLLLSVDEDGGLQFWVPAVPIDSNGRGRGGKPRERNPAWRCTGFVNSRRKGFFKARCSSTKKSVLVVRTPNGDEVSIWDSKESEFSSGLEWSQTFDVSDPVVDLDWTATPDGQSILAIGFPHHVLLLYQQRMTYFDQEPRWGILDKYDISQVTLHTITDSVWVSSARFLIGSGHQMFLTGRPGVGAAGKPKEDLIEKVVRRNGPLPDYHPQMLLQLLLWEKFGLVKDIITKLALELRYLTKDEWDTFEMPRMPIEAFLEDQESGPTGKGAVRRAQHSALFDEPEGTFDDKVFSSPLVARLVQQLEDRPLPFMTPNEHDQLLVLLETSIEIEEQRRALDVDGLRYLISMRSFHILNKRVSSPGGRSPDPNQSQDPVPPVVHSALEYRRGFRARIRYRDMVWAFHSNSQEILLAASTIACGGKMLWKDARAIGVFLWLNSIESLKSQMEAMARNQYMLGEERDPTKCCLFYIALGKVRLVQGLWRQASWHPESNIMTKFLSNDFELVRWKTAALKNAYALLGKRRNELAAAFFLLGGSLKDAVNVCLKQLGDFQLAVALARVVEGDNGPVLTYLLKEVVIPIAFAEGNRWLGSWAFWKLNRRDLAVRILVTPLSAYARSLAEEGFTIGDVAESDYDDPSLALMYARIKSMSLQTIKGSSMISGQTEFNFVAQMARVFCRMGCHALALCLASSWSFEPPRLPSRLSTAPETPIEASRSPTRRRSVLGHSRRPSSMIIDIDVQTEIPEPPTTPTYAVPPAGPVQHSSLMTVPEDTEVPLVAAPSPMPVEEPPKRTGLGTLMQTAKKDVQVPEFDMSAFL